MKIILITMLSLVSISSLASSVHESCLRRSDEVNIYFRGQGLASFLTYKLDLTFEPYSLSFSYFTNRGSDMEVYYNAEELTRTRTDMYPYRRSDIMAAHDSPENFNLSVTRGILDQLMVAQKNMLTRIPELEIAVECARQRAIAIKNEVSNKLILQRNIVN